MTVVAKPVRVESLEGGPARFGVLVEDPATGRALIALASVTEQELMHQLDALGGAAAYARRFGAEPLDPEGMAAGPSWVPPGGSEP